MMHQGMDLSRFRKVSSDGKSSTLKHRNGHEMKVAHGGISPKMREAIDGMPLHLADGTVEGPVVAPPPAPAPAGDVMSGVMAGVPTAAPAAPAPLAPPPDPTPISNDRMAINPAAHAQELNQEDERYAQDKAAGHIAPKTMHDQLFANKSTLGKIGTIFGLMVGGAGAGLAHQPNALLELMQKEIDRDLDAQKASAANKQNWYRLNLDHEMQRATIGRLGVQNTATAAETALTAGRTAQLPVEAKRIEAETAGALAGVPLKKAQTALTYAEAEKARLANKLLGEDIGVPGAGAGGAPAAPPAPAAAAPSAAVAPHPAEVHALADAGAKNKMAAAAGDHINEMVAKMPPGPAKDAAVAMATTVVTPGIRAYMMTNNEKAAATVAHVRAQGVVNSPAPAAAKGDDSGINDKALQHELARGRAASTLGGVNRGIPPSQEGAAIQAADLVKKNRAIYKSWREAYEKLDTAALGGQLNDGARKAAVNGLTDQIAKSLNLSHDAAVQLSESLFPNAKDWGSARMDKARFGWEHFKNAEAGTTPIDLAGIKTDFPTAPKLSKNKAGSVGGIMSKVLGDGSAAAAPSSGPKEGDLGTAKDMKGKSVPVVYRGGIWVPK